MADPALDKDATILLLVVPLVPLLLLLLQAGCP